MCVCVCEHVDIQSSFARREVSLQWCVNSMEQLTCALGIGMFCRVSRYSPWRVWDPPGGDRAFYRAAKYCVSVCLDPPPYFPVGCCYVAGFAGDFNVRSQLYSKFLGGKRYWQDEIMILYKNVPLTRAEGEIFLLPLTSLNVMSVIHSNRQPKISGQVNNQTKE